jgi:hypothetical protein
MTTSYIKWDDDDVSFVLDWHYKLYIYSSSSLQQQSVCIIMILRQPVFVFTHTLMIHA